MNESGGLDYKAALAIAGDDPVLLQELAQLFLQEYPILIADLRAAARERDPKKLEARAHALKGALVNFGARTAVEAALLIESKGRAGNTDGVDEDLLSLERILQPFVVELGALNDFKN